MSVCHLCARLHYAIQTGTVDWHFHYGSGFVRRALDVFSMFIDSPLSTVDCAYVNDQMLMFYMDGYLIRESYWTYNVRLFFFTSLIPTVGATGHCVVHLVAL